MSEVKVNKISPRTACGTVTLGDSGDTFTFPSGVTITNNGTQTGFGREGSVDWQTGSIKTGTFTAATGEGYFVNTAGAISTVNLPAGAAGSIVAISDYTRTFASNNCTVSPNGAEKMGGIAQNVILDVSGQSATFVYVDGTEGWINVQETQTSQAGVVPFICASVTGACNTLTTAPDCGDYKLATFLGPGNFTVCAAASCTTRNAVAYMVVAGGGSGGGKAGGGGGAGGFREGTTSPMVPYAGSPLVAPTGITVTATTYPITVGGGGAGVAPPSIGTNGSTSIFSTISSAGGGGGGLGYTGNGAAGGSGGGGAGASTGGPPGGSGGAGDTPATPIAQGTPGGVGAGPTAQHEGGGGGGATVAGTAGSTSPSGGPGGNGASTSISGSPVARGGGGGGGNQSSPAGSGGSGGGGAGAEPPSTGTAGTVNTGGGGGGNAFNPGNSGAGGSGIVIIRYKFQ